jgi:hypothetical protein
VPIRSPVVRAASPAAEAMPKSSTLTSPAAVRNTLPGLTSRWTTPARWAASSASATAATTRAASAGAIGPARPIRASRLSPSSSSITR